MKALWLVDIFDKDFKSYDEVANTLRGLGFNQEDQIWCTYLAQESEPNLNLAYDVPKADRLTKLPDGILAKRIASLKLKGLRVLPSVISTPGISMKSGADRVVADAKAKNADLIVLQTHSRKGFKRLLLGSFAETLIHRSPVSLLILNPKTKAKSSVKRIVYATDLAKSANKSVLKAAEFAKRAGAELRLVHVPLPSYDVKFAGQDLEVDAYRKSVPKRLSQLVKIASAGGLKVDSVIAKPNKPISEAIDFEAKRFKADLTAMRSDTGPVESLFLGSVGRSLVRLSTRPVLILRD